MSKTYKIQKYKCRMVKDGALTSVVNTIESCDDAAAFFMKSLKGLPHEELHVVFLNGKNSIIGFEAVARGSQSGMCLAPGDIFRSALAVNARHIIVAHNHPSGDCTPSRDDIEFSKQIFRAGAIIGIRLTDSLVCCPEAKKWTTIRFEDD